MTYDIRNLGQCPAFLNHNGTEDKINLKIMTLETVESHVDRNAAHVIDIWCILQVPRDRER